METIVAFSAVESEHCLRCYSNTRSNQKFPFISQITRSTKSPMNVNYYNGIVPINHQLCNMSLNVSLLVLLSLLLKVGVTLLSVLLHGHHSSSRL